jgi:hypothetical protein
MREFESLTALHRTKPKTNKQTKKSGDVTIVSEGLQNEEFCTVFRAFG